MSEAAVKTYYDSKGIPVRPGDILRVFHFIARQRRQRVYMYKKVFRGNDCGRLDPNGDRLIAVDMLDLREKPLEECYACCVEWLVEFEVIDGHFYHDDAGEIVCWWERPHKLSGGGVPASSVPTAETSAWDEQFSRLGLSQMGVLGLGSSPV